jgi:hypothetical protein
LRRIKQQNSESALSDGLKGTNSDRSGPKAILNLCKALKSPGTVYLKKQSLLRAIRGKVLFDAHGMLHTFTV